MSKEYIKQLEQRIEELQGMLAKPHPWEPRWENGEGDNVYEYRNDHVLFAIVKREFITYRVKFFVATTYNYDLKQFNTSEEAKDFITMEIIGISWKSKGFGK